jgi:hypothetical protein
VWPDASRKPDVACDYTRDIFLVVWEYDYHGAGGFTHDWDIQARAVYGRYQSSGSQFFSDVTFISAIGDNEHNPAVACNSNDHTCLVVYYNDDHNSGDIYGNRITIGINNISKSNPFPIAATTSWEGNPDVAWGSGEDAFLVVFEVDYASGNYIRSGFRAVFDTEQVGSQFKSSLFYLLQDGSYTNDQRIPAVAYNPRQREYLVVFAYLYDEINYKSKIVGQRITKGYAFRGDPFVITTAGLSHAFSPSVVFSNGSSEASSLGMEQYLVAYSLVNTLGQTLIVSQAVYAYYVSRASQLDGQAVLVDTVAEDGYATPSLDAVASTQNGKYLVVWDRYPNSGIRGRFLSPYQEEQSSGHDVYIPFLTK